MMQTAALHHVVIANGRVIDPETKLDLNPNLDLFLLIHRWTIDEQTAKVESTEKSRVERAIQETGLNGF